MLYKKHRLSSRLLDDDKVDPTHNEEIPVCTKGCYNAVIKILNKGNDTRIPWNKDGRNGEEDPNNSDAILINWLITEGNYRRYQEDIGHHKKVDVAKRVADIINAAGVCRKRTGKQVQSKIEHLQACFKNAFTYANSETGAGLKEKDVGGFEDQCLRRCPHYFDLYNVFANRPGVQPAVTSDKRNNSDDSENKGVNLDEQKKIAEMAFDNDSEDDDGQDDDNSSLALSSKLQKDTNFAKKHRHQTPPRKAKNASLYAYGSSSSKKSFEKGGRSSSESHSSRKKYSKPDPEMLLLQEQHNESMRLKEINLKETVRHNKAMEASAAWDTRLKELEYKLSLMEKFKTFCKQGYSKKTIARHFPEMKMLCDMEEKDLDEESNNKKPLAKRNSRTK